MSDETRTPDPPEHLAAARSMADSCLCFRARRVSRALTRLYDDALRPLGLEANQLTLLNAIALLEPEGAPTGRLAEVLSVDATTLSRNLRPLERDGLIELARLARDRRVRRVKLTDAGRRRIAEALPLWNRAQARITSLLGPELASDLLSGFDAAVAAATDADSEARPADAATDADSAGRLADAASTANPVIQEAE